MMKKSVRLKEAPIVPVKEQVTLTFVFHDCSRKTIEHAGSINSYLDLQFAIARYTQINFMYLALFPDKSIVT